ncbi:WD40 repeat domain-containing protein [Mesorhizobium sp. M0663]
MRFESAELVDKLVNEVVNMPGGLPLLSFALSEMYMSYLQRRGTDRALTQADYDALKGGVVGSLQVGANQVVDDRNRTLLDTARRVLERFVSVEGGEFTRRRVPRWELDVREPAEQERINHILNRLVEKRLVVTDEAGGQSYLEFAHDALIRGWNRLQGWVREDAERIAALRRLTFDARRWQNPGNASTLWDDPARVALIKDLQAAPSPGLNSIEHDFAVAGLKRMRRNAAIRWSAIAALLIFAVGAFGSALYANNQSKIASENQKAAERSARVAVSRLLSSEADAAMPDFPQRSLLLSKAAVSSTQADEPTETRSANALAVGLARVKGRPLLAGRQRAASVAVSANATRIALAADNGSVASFNLSGSSPNAFTQGAPSDSKEISVSPGGRWLVSFDHNSIAHLKDFKAMPAAPTILTPAGAESRLALFSPDERWIFVVGENGPSGSANAEPGEPIAQIWDLSSQPPSPLEIPLTAFSANELIIYPRIHPQLITFSPTGEYFVTRHRGESTEIWFLRRPSPELVASMPASSARDLPIKFSPDGRWLLISESPGDRSRLWYLPKDGGKPVPYSFSKDIGDQQDPAGNTAPAAVTAVAFSSDNKMAVGSADGFVRVWALSERNPLVSPVLSFKHNVSMGRLEYSPDGHWLLAKPELISDEGVTGRIFVSMDRDRRPLLFFTGAAPDFPHFDLFGDEAKDFAFSKGSDWLLVRSPGLDVWHLSEDRNLPNVTRFQTDTSATVARFIGGGETHRSS